MSVPRGWRASRIAGGSIWPRRRRRSRRTRRRAPRGALAGWIRRGGGVSRLPMNVFLIILLVLAMLATVGALVRGIAIFLMTSKQDLMGPGPSVSGMRQNKM